MKTRDAKGPPPSLLDLFDAPEDFRGRFGWLCGYSADAQFLDKAAERFTRLTNAQRAHAGRITIAAMLDPHNPQIVATEVPGVLHLPCTDPAAVPFRLLHAKVALLGFAHEREDLWRLRLVVSTGNWTRETLEQTLDLVWTAEIEGPTVAPSDEAATRNRADVRAAWDMLTWIRAYFDDRALTLVPAGTDRTETQSALRQFESWLDRAGERTGGVAPRFFDNRAASLLDQLPARIEAAAGATARNWLCFGSGFYESASRQAPDRVPSVLEEIVSTLQGGRRGPRLLTAGPGIDVFVNPAACQAIAQTLPALRSRRWSVRPPRAPEYMGQGERSLHAKFLFSAFHREDSESCSSAWLYLGSGNLTAAGFTQPAYGKRGNLEAGVVIETPGHTWDSLRGVLPVQWETSLDGTAGALQPGAEMDPAPPAFRAPPVACLQLVENEEGHWLQTLHEPTSPFDILDPAGHPCARGEKGFAWTGEVPRQAKVRWTVKDETLFAEVPVMDGYGRIAGSALPAIDLEEAWWQLASFPLPPPDEELREEARELAGDRVSSRPTAGAARYPVRELMALVENIAALQIALGPSDWAAWCARLEQTLAQASGSPAIDGCKALGLNLLSPLREPPFRPDFACDASSPEGARYEAVLVRVEASWGMDAMARIGEVA